MLTDELVVAGNVVDVVDGGTVVSGKSNPTNVLTNIHVISESSSNKMEALVSMFSQEPKTK